jgi:hypothetical protein
VGGPPLEFRRYYELSQRSRPPNATLVALRAGDDNFIVDGDPRGPAPLVRVRVTFVACQLFEA